MIHLSGMHASFLHLETPEMPMLVGSPQIAKRPCIERSLKPSVAAVR